LPEPLAIDGDPKTLLFIPAEPAVPPVTSDVGDMDMANAALVDVDVDVVGGAGPDVPAVGLLPTFTPSPTLVDEDGIPARVVMLLAESLCPCR
jgi:hypothetical protein